MSMMCCLQVTSKLQLSQYIQARGVDGTREARAVSPAVPEAVDSQGKRVAEQQLGGAPSLPSKKRKLEIPALKGALAVSADEASACSETALGKPLDGASPQRPPFFSRGAAPLL